MGDEEFKTLCDYIAEAMRLRAEGDAYYELRIVEGNTEIESGKSQASLRVVEDSKSSGA
jgi:hypothetical protein